MIGVFVAALMIGTLLTSFLAERFGRLIMLRWSLGLTSLSEFFILGSGDQYYFTIFLFFLTIPLPGTFLCSLSYICEVSSGYYRKISVTFLLTFLILGYLPSYYLVFEIGSWRPVVLTSLISGVLCLTFSCLLVESPRYLAIIFGRYSKARSAFEYIAKVNKASMFEEHLQGEILNEYSETIRKRQILDMSGLDNSELPEMNELSDQRDNMAVPFEYLGGAANAVDREKDLDRGQKYGYSDIFKEDLRRITLTLTLCWIVISFSSYSFTHSGIIDNKEYRNCIFLVLISFFGALLACSLSYYLKTKRLFSIYLMSSGIFIIVQGALLMNQHSIPAIYSIGLFLLSGLNVSAFEYTLEVTATPYRCISLGFFQFWAIVGVIIGYFSMSYLIQFFIVFGVLACLLPILLRNLPETGHLPLNDFSSWNMIS